jgi:hypothetical protein
LPSDGALVALKVSFEKKKKVFPSVKQELLKMKLVDNSGKITSDGKSFLNEPKVMKKIKEIGS